MLKDSTGYLASNNTHTGDEVAFSVLGTALSLDSDPTVYTAVCTVNVASGRDIGPLSLVCTSKDAVSLGCNGGSASQAVLCAHGVECCCLPLGQVSRSSISLPHNFHAVDARRDGVSNHRRRPRPLH